MKNIFVTYGSDNLINQNYNTKICYPPYNDIFNAFNLCDYQNLKVVILGQDPYHQPLQANGLSFSVNEGVKHPPSLINIFKEDPKVVEVSLSKAFEKSYFIVAVTRDNYFSGLLANSNHG